MICYRDRSYCGSETDDHNCSAVITEEELEDAKRIGLPIALVKYCEEQSNE